MTPRRAHHPTVSPGLRLRRKGRLRGEGFRTVVVVGDPWTVESRGGETRGPGSLEPHHRNLADREGEVGKEDLGPRREDGGRGGKGGVDWGTGLQRPPSPPPGTDSGPSCESGEPDTRRPSTLCRRALLLTGKVQGSSHPHTGCSSPSTLPVSDGDRGAKNHRDFRG